VAEISISTHSPTFQRNDHWGKNRRCPVWAGWAYRTRSSSSAGIATPTLGARPQRGSSTPVGERDYPGGWWEVGPNPLKQEGAPGPDGDFVENFRGHETIVHCLAVNEDGVLVSGGDNGTIKMWDWASGLSHRHHGPLIVLRKDRSGRRREK